MYLAITLIILSIILITLLYSTFSYAVVIMLFWDWFLKPVFPNLIEITYLQSVGLALTMTLIKSQLSLISTKQEENSTFVMFTKSIGIILAPWLLLLVGYLIKLFIY